MLKPAIRNDSANLELGIVNSVKSHRFRGVCSHLWDERVQSSLG